MINDALQIWIQKKLVSSRIIIHPKTRHLPEQCLCICKKHLLLFEICPFLRKRYNSPATGAGQILYTHLNITSDHLFQHAAHTHTHETDIRFRLHFSLDKRFKKTHLIKLFSSIILIFLL